MIRTYATTLRFAGKVAEGPVPYMRTFRDFQNTSIRLSSERRQHIQDHPEMIDMEQAITETLASPQTVIQSLSDQKARLYYRYYYGTKVGGKYMCVVVKMAEQGAFILTAYLTDTVKKGVVLWPKKS